MTHVFQSSNTQQGIKKILAILLFSTLLLSASTDLFAEDDPGKSKVTTAAASTERNVFGIIGFADYFASNHESIYDILPSLGFIIHPAKNFAIKPSLGFMYRNAEYNTAVFDIYNNYSSIKENIDTFQTGASVSLLYYTDPFKNISLYGGLSLGYSLLLRKSDLEKKYNDYHGISSGIIIGAQYMFTEKFGIFMDSGLSYSYSFHKDSKAHYFGLKGLSFGAVLYL